MAKHNRYKCQQFPDLSSFNEHWRLGACTFLNSANYAQLCNETPHMQ